MDDSGLGSPVSSGISSDKLELSMAGDHAETCRRAAMINPSKAVFASFTHVCSDLQLYEMTNIMSAKQPCRPPVRCCRQFQLAACSLQVCCRGGKHTPCNYRI